MKEFFQHLDTSQKGFYTFTNSAHSPLWEEAEKTIQILTEDVLQKQFTWADK